MPYGLFDYGETIQTMGLSPLPPAQWTDNRTGQTFSRDQVLAREGIPLSGIATSKAQADRYTEILKSLPSKYTPVQPTPVQPPPASNVKVGGGGSGGGRQGMLDSNYTTIRTGSTLTQPYRPPTGTTRYPEEPTMVTRAFPEDGSPITLAIPEDGIVKVRADDAPPPSGGCPKGYEPSGGGKPPQGRPAPIGEGRPAPVTLAIPE